MRLAFLPFLLLLFGLSAAPAKAQQAPGMPSHAYGSAYYGFQPLNAVKASEYIDLSGSIFSNHTFDVTPGTGTLSTCTFNVQGSSDLVQWYDLSGTQSCTVALMFHITDKPIRYVRINILTYSGTAVLAFHYAGAI